MLIFALRSRRRVQLDLAHLHISNSLSEQGVGTARLAIQDSVEILAITLGDDFSINLSLYSYFDIRILKHFSDL